MQWLLFSVLVSIIVYAFVIRPKLLQFRAVADIIARIDAPHVTRWQKFKLWLFGQKVSISGLIGVLVTAAPGALQQLQGVDFAAFFPPSLALKISGGIMITMAVMHIFSMVTAAEIEPAKPAKED